MFQKLITALAGVIILFTTVAAQDYCFPSRKPPAGKNPADIPMYVTLIWDDNAYSGFKGAAYESEAKQTWENINRVEGYQFKPWHSSKNTLNISEGDIGGSWAVRTLAGTRRNPSGRAIKMTFNVITGQMAPVTWKVGWVANPVEGDVWGWKEYTFETVDWASINSPPIKSVLAPVCWGREYEVLTNGGSEKEEQPHTVNMYKEFLEKHELGNHTIDHMESNSGLPQEEWPNNGEGFDDDPNENEQYPPWEVIGWLIDAGRNISVQCWKDAIALGEAELDEYLSATVANGKVFGFRAPRLEINSNCFQALKQLNYTYDCGLEEGWEDDIDGKTAWWPYTTDNGSPNVWSQIQFGEAQPQYKDWPAGFWELPVNTFIVPENIRDAVWANGKEINDAAPDAGDWEPLDSWKLHGRITGFDFNMFILWGMTSANWLTTMQHNLDLRLAGNKAPLHYGCHTDYYTPMYDFATLLNDYNASSYGLCVTKGWNTYSTRISTYEQFVDYALGKGCEFISGIELINEMRDMLKDEQFGKEVAFDWADWRFFKNPTLTSTASTQQFIGNIDNVTVIVSATSGSEVPNAGFGAYENAGNFEGLDHIALTYKTNNHLALRITVAGDKPWEVVLGNLDTERNSGKIPIDAFRYSPYNQGTETSIKTENITGIEVKCLTPGTSQITTTFSVKDIKLYGVDNTKVVIDNYTQAHKYIALNAITKSLLKLKIGTAGRYTVSIVGANGKVVRSFSNVDFSAGNNSLKLNNLSSGIYMIKVGSRKIQRTMKAMVL